MKKVIGFTMLLLILTNFSSNAETTVFRSDKDKFRFSYPSDWLVKQGNGANVKAKVTSNKDGVSCNVVVRKVPNFTNSDYISNFSIQEMFQDFKERFTDAKLLNGGLGFIDNTKAHVIIVDYSYSALNKSVKLRSIIAQTARKEKAYNLTCASHRSLFTKYELVFADILTSFVFEDWQ